MNINISNFKILKTTKIANMFSICSSLEEIDISNFNANYMISTEKMFCVNLLILHLSRNFKPKKNR